jgi:hypothetical protein
MHSVGSSGHIGEIMNDLSGPGGCSGRHGRGAVFLSSRISTGAIRTGIQSRRLGPVLPRHTRISPVSR